MSDQRANARLAVSVDVQVRAMGSVRWIAARLREISRGGCRLLVKEGVGQPNHEIEIWLPSKAESGLIAGARVLRVDTERGENLVIARFQTRDPIEQAGLDWVCAMLLSRSGGGRRADVRVAYRLDIQYGNDAELTGILEDISRNGFLMLSVKTAPIYTSPYG